MLDSIYRESLCSQSSKQLRDSGRLGRIGNKGVGIASPDAQARFPAADVEEFFRRRVVELKHGRVSMLVPRPPSAALLRQSTRFTASQASVLNSWRLRSSFSQSLESRKLCGRCSVSRSRCMAPYSPTWDPGISIQASSAQKPRTHFFTLFKEDPASLNTRTSESGIFVCPYSLKSIPFSCLCCRFHSCC